MNDKIVVSGLGIYSPIGKSVAEVVDTLKQSGTGISDIDCIDTTKFRNGCGGVVKDIDDVETLNGMRSNLLLRHAFDEGINDSGIATDSTIDKSRVGVSIGTSLGGYGGFVDYLYERTAAKKGERYESLLNPKSKISGDEVIKNIPPVLLAYEVAKKYNFSGGVSSSVTACSASANALAMAHDAISSGRVDYVIAGGVDPLTQLTYLGFNALMAMTKSELKTMDRNRSGLLIGEGAACLVLEKESTAKARGARIYAYFKGYGISNDAYHCTRPHPDAVGATLAIKKALDMAELTQADIDYVNVHGTGTKHNDLMELKALSDIFQERCATLPVSSSKSMMGHTLGAAGAIESVISVLAIKEGFLPPNINSTEDIEGYDYNLVREAVCDVDVNNVISNSFGFGGNCASLVFGKNG